MLSIATTFDNKPMPTQTASNPEPYFEWKYELNEETWKREFKIIEISDGKQIDSDKFQKTLKRTVGTSDPKLGERILNKVSYGLKDA